MTTGGYVDIPLSLYGYGEPESPTPLAIVRRRIQRKQCAACGATLRDTRRRLCGACQKAGLKYCPACETVKAVDAFSVKRRDVSGREAYCWECDGRREPPHRQRKSTNPPRRRRESVEVHEQRGKLLVELHDKDGLTWEQAGAQFGISKLAAKSHARRWRVRQQQQEGTR